jgi:hypothetical protein
MQNLHSTTSLKLFGYGIKSLYDPNWTGMFLYDQIKQHVRGRVEPTDLLRKPLEKGLPYHLGLWFFEEYFSLTHLEGLNGEYAIWFIEDYSEMAAFHKCASTSAFLKVELLINRVNELYESNEEEYYAYIESDDAMTEVQMCYKSMISCSSNNFEHFRNAYAEDFADRMLHDRQLCFYVSNLIYEIGFNGADDIDGEPKAWVERKKWPERIKAILRARDRGFCNECGANVVQELEDEMQIDHMIPIAKGGCNDIINLQILCAPCNRRKSANSTYVKSSVPKYLKRKAPKK